MKIYRSSNTNGEYICGMSMPRAFIISRMEYYSGEFTDHIMKAVIFKNKYNCLDHWVYGEIANYASIVNDFRTKPSNKKLKEQDYLKYFLGGLDGDYNDIKLLIRGLVSSSKFKSDYEPVKITDELVSEMQGKFYDIRDYLLPILSTENNLTQNDIGHVIMNIIKGDNNDN